jgi:hypothetical protein
MRPHVLFAIAAVALLTSGCAPSSIRPSKTIESTTTTTTVTVSTVTAKHYLRDLLADSSKDAARDEKALAVAPKNTYQISHAYTQFEDDTLTLQAKVASYHWPRVAAEDAGNLVLALSALAADWQLRASNIPVPNYNHDNDTVIADLQRLSADLGST